MKYLVSFILMSLIFANNAVAEEEDWLAKAAELPSAHKTLLWKYPKFEIENDNDTVWTYLIAEVFVYPPMRFKNVKEMQKYNRLVYNIKRVLPLAQKVNAIIQETYTTLELLPDKKSKQAHIKAIEKELWNTYKPEMQKLTYSQGKLLIKLVDRECNQSSYEVVKAFIGPARATFYQVFAWTFHASLKKEYQPEKDDKLVERIVKQIESGQL